MPTILGLFLKRTKIILAILLSISIALMQPIYAFATTSLSVKDAEAAVSDAKDTLAYAQERLDAISSEFNALSGEIQELQNQIDELSTQVLAAQEAMLDGRELVSSAAVHEYRSSTFSTILDVFLGSADLTELSRNMDYISNIVSHQAEEIQIQKELREQFTTASDKLTQQKDEQEEKLEVLNKKREEANSVVEEASQSVEASSSELDSLKKQAEQFVWQNKSGTPIPDKNADTTDRKDVVSPETPVVPNTSNNTGNGWKTGIASAYGGSSDPWTPNPGVTATGAICDDNSKGVAVSVYMPNYSSYLGRTVEISYNGMTVYATVNDTGNMGGGSRALDLQPGVFKAFGYSDCYSWGLRTVSYRFL